MKIGKSVIPHTAISTSDAESITVRGADLCGDLIGRLSFTDYFYFLLTGERPSERTRAVLDATLVAIAEHGMVPSVQASRMTLAAAPDALQGAVAAGILGCGSVIFGAAESAGRLLFEISQSSEPEEVAVRAAVTRLKQAREPIPGYGHPQHKDRDPRVAALFAVAKSAEADTKFIRLAELVERVIPEIVGKELRLNVSAAIPAVLLGVGFPVDALKGVPILARTAGLIAHLHEERVRPSGFALSYQASREVIYDGEHAESKS